MRNETKPQNVNTFIWLGKMKHTVLCWNITAMETNVPCNHVACNTCAQTQTHTLPGLCHSAAVTATALRAPAHSQLLLRLTAIKVISEFSKTRHLSCLSSPPVLERSLPFEPLIKKKTFLVLFLLLGAQSSGFSSAFYLDSVSATGPSLPVLPHPSSAPLLMCRRTI